MKRSLAAILLVASMSTAAGADDMTEAITRVASVGRSSSPSFSPDASRIAFVSDLAGVPQIFIVPTAGGWPVQVTSGTDPVSSVAWSPKGDLLAYTVNPGGGLNVQVYVTRPDGTQVRRLTDGGKENNGLGEWSKDGRLLTITSNRRDPAAIDAYVYDVAAKKLRLVARGDGIGTITSLSDDARRAVMSRVATRGDNNLYLLDLKAKRETHLTPHRPPAQFSGLIAPRGDGVYLTTNDGRDLAAFGRMPLGKGGPGPVEVIAERTDAEPQGFVLNRAGTAAAVMWNVAGKSELALVDLVTGKSTPGPTLPAEIAIPIEFSRDDKLLSFAATGPRAPVDIWVMDVATRRLRQVTHSPHPGVDLEAMVRPELVRFRAHDGLALTGWLYRPVGVKGPAPYVVSFHGGPEGQERPTFRSDYQALLAQGIGVFAPNVRGSAGFGKKFVNLDNGALRTGSVADIKASVDFLVKSRIAAPRRIGITGGSYGGYMVMAGMTEYPDLFAAGVNLFGIVNFATFFKHSEPWMGAISKTEYGDPATQKEMLEKLSPLHKLDRLKGALMVQHGANDTNVPVIEAEQIVASLKKRGVPVEYVLFADEGHGWRKPTNRIRSTVEMTRFFVTHLRRR
jgi:dipeptidyl aminopeptidase/acylaminoacyl peptidase